MAKDRPIAELLEVLLKYFKEVHTQEEDSVSGLCMAILSMRHAEIITNDEFETLRIYISEHRPLLYFINAPGGIRYGEKNNLNLMVAHEKLELHVNLSCFGWNPQDNDARIEWLEDHIKISPVLDETIK